VLRPVPDGAANPIGLRLQVLESDHLDTARNGMLDGAATIQSIALGEAGEPIGYWLHRVHPGAAWIMPGATWQGSERIPASEVLHIYRKRRPGQLRDVSPVTRQTQVLRREGARWVAEMTFDPLNSTGSWPAWRSGSTAPGMWAACTGCARPRCPQAHQQ
jgi:hypothetical protein